MNTYYNKNGAICSRLLRYFIVDYSERCSERYLGHNVGSTCGRPNYRAFKERPYDAFDTLT